MSSKVEHPTEIDGNKVRNGYYVRNDDTIIRVVADKAFVLGEVYNIDYPKDSPTCGDYHMTGIHEDTILWKNNNNHEYRWTFYGLEHPLAELQSRKQSESQLQLDIVR